VGGDRRTRPVTDTHERTYDVMAASGHMARFWCRGGGSASGNRCRLDGQGLGLQSGPTDRDWLALVGVTHATSAGTPPGGREKAMAAAILDDGNRSASDRSVHTIMVVRQFQRCTPHPPPRAGGPSWNDAAPRGAGPPRARWSPRAAQGFARSRGRAWKPESRRPQCRSTWSKRRRHHLLGAGRGKTIA